VIVRLVVVGLCGAAAGVIGHLAIARAARRGRLLRAIPIAAVLLAFHVSNQYATPAAQDWWADVQARSAARSLEGALRETTKDPVFVSYVRDLERRGIPPERALDKRELAARGMGRPTDADLAARSEMTGRALGTADVTTCAKVLRGTAARDDHAILRALAALAREDELRAVARAFEKGASDADACAGARLLYEYLPRLAEPTRSELAFILLGP
jgi:hypothetical protein